MRRRLRGAVRGAAHEHPRVARGNLVPRIEDAPGRGDHFAAPVHLDRGGAHRPRERREGAVVEGVGTARNHVRQQLEHALEVDAEEEAQAVAPAGKLGVAQRLLAPAPQRQPRRVRPFAPLREQRDQPRECDRRLPRLPRERILEHGASAVLVAAPPARESARRQRHAPSPRQFRVGVRAAIGAHDREQECTLPVGGCSGEALCRLDVTLRQREMAGDGGEGFLEHAVPGVLRQPATQGREPILERRDLAARQQRPRQLELLEPEGAVDHAAAQLPRSPYHGLGRPPVEAVVGEHTAVVPHHGDGAARAAAVEEALGHP